MDARPLTTALCAALLALAPGCVTPSRAGPAEASVALAPLPPAPPLGDAPPAGETPAATSPQAGGRGPLPGAERKAFLLRVPHELFDEVRAWAQRDLRSVNAQIEFLLREALERDRARAAAAGSGPGC